MSLIDITRTIYKGMVVYEGDAPFEKVVTSEVVEGDPGSCSLSQIEMGSHIGTHVDAPYHFVAGGAKVDELPLEALCGPARVVDVSDRGNELDEELFRSLDLGGARRILLKTSLEDPEKATKFDHDYAHLTESGARYLRELGVVLIGIDSLSIDGFPEPGFEFPAHHVLLDEDGVHPPVVIVEGLQLNEVAEGGYEFWCLPLKIGGADGAPARAVLSTQD